MALFNDGPINRTEELAQQDSSLLETASIEGIDVAARIASAQDTIATEILTFLLNSQPGDPLFGGAVNYRRRALGVSDVVVTPELKRWHAFEALGSVYRDANGHQFNDRYQWKCQEFGTLAAMAKEKCLGVGVGLTADPICRGAAPVVTTVPGIGGAATLFFAVALVNAAGEEGTASDAVMVNLASDTQAEIRLSASPDNARGWDLYAGSDGGSLARQNGEALAVADTWTQPSELKAGGAPGAGQKAMTYVVLNRVMRRG